MAILAEPSANFHSSGMHWIPPESLESGRNLWGTDKTSKKVETQHMETLTHTQEYDLFVFVENAYT